MRAAAATAASCVVMIPPSPAITFFVASSQVTSFPSNTPESALTGYRALVVTTYTGWGLGAAALAGGLIWGLVAGSAAPVSLVPSVGAHGEVSLSLCTRL